MNNRLEAIKLRFPEYSEMIQKQSEKNEDFEAICLDYGQCMDMLRSLGFNETTSRNARLEEYLEIKIELEQEVMKWLFR